VLTASTLFGGEAWKGEGGSQGWAPRPCRWARDGPLVPSRLLPMGPSASFILVTVP
jgi:hypothetical protein